MGRPALDLTGQVFGKLTAIRRVKHNAAHKRARWLCKCACGTYTEVYSSPLRKKIRSCGCSQYQYEDISNWKFNRLLVIEREGKGWRCICDCGTETLVEISHLKKGIVKSCGCYNIERKRWIDNGSNKRNVRRSYINGAKTRKFSWNLTDDAFWELLEGQCHYCGRIAGNKRVKKDSNAPAYHYTGIDRVDNSLGYSEQNCVSCCRFCNRSKGAFTYAEFKLWIKDLCAYNLNQKA